MSISFTLDTDETISSAKVAYTNEMLAQKIAQLTSEMQALGSTLLMAEKLDKAYKRVTKEFFKDFAGFDNNASISFGLHFKRALAEVVESDPGAIRDTNTYILLENVMMDKLLTKSRSEFFLMIRFNKTLRELFSKTLAEYCKVTWFVEMQKHGTVLSKSPITRKLMSKAQGTAKEDAQVFLDDACARNPQAEVPFVEFYSAYEGWCIKNQASILGKRQLSRFLKEEFTCVDADPVKNLIVGIYIEDMDVCNSKIN